MANKMKTLLKILKMDFGKKTAQGIDTIEGNSEVY